MNMQVDGERIWINRGQIQWSLLYPDLFNIYINVLIESLKDAGLNPVAYGDDLATMCDGEANISKSMDLIERWAGRIDIEVKKKSDILIIQNKRGNEEYIRRYLVKNCCKRLSVRLEYIFKPITNLKKTR